MLEFFRFRGGNQSFGNGGQTVNVVEMALPVRVDDGVCRFGGETFGLSGVRLTVRYSVETSRKPYFSMQSGSFASFCG